MSIANTARWLLVAAFLGGCSAAAEMPAAATAAGDSTAAIALLTAPAANLPAPQP